MSMEDSTTELPREEGTEREDPALYEHVVEPQQPIRHNNPPESKQPTVTRKTQGIMTLACEANSLLNNYLFTVTSRKDHQKGVSYIGAIFRSFVTPSGINARVLQAFQRQDRHHPFKMLLIGETGSGKTSFLNLLYNCATVQALSSGFGAEGLEQLKQFNDIKLENAQALPMETRTNDATLYNVEVGDLKVGVINTPGFGDLRGFKQDKTKVQRIISTLKREEYINCVCLVIHGRQPRASASLKYVLSEITAILPRRIIDNLIVVFSNTADALDLNYDTNVLKEYFGKEVENTFFVENPYCRLEKAKAKLGQLGIEKVAKSLKKSFEETSEVLTEMCKTIADFPEVHTHHFIELYEKKKAIEKNVLDSLTAYDNQMMLEKSLKDAKAEVDAAVKSKTLNKDFKTIQTFVKWVVKETDDHNTLCGFKGCHSNCHVPCYLQKSFDKEVFKRCACIINGDEDEMCNACTHSYTYHYHNDFIHEKVVEDLISDDEKFEKAESDEERATMLYSNFERKLNKSKAKRKKLSEKLSSNILEFESLGVACNYAKLIENQLAVIETHLEGTVVPDTDDLCKIKNDLEKRLKVIQAAKSGSIILTL